MNIIIDQGFKSLMVPLTSEEFNQLEKNLLDWGCKDKLTVWSVSGSDDTLVLLDGHNRYTICTKHDIPFEVEKIELETRDTAIAWIIDYQLGRRNITPEQQSYLRGVQYEREKGKHGGDRKSKHQNDDLKTAEKLATQHKVSKPTIERDAQYARAVNAVDKAAGNGAKTTLLSRDTKVSKQDAVRLGAIAESSPQAVKNVLEQIEETKNPKAVSGIIKDAHKIARQGVALMEQDQQVRQTSIPKLVLTSPETEDRDEELISEDGRKLYILHRPNSKPVFNSTNEMVDWANWTWNPVTGCLHGCSYCYARDIANNERMAKSYPYKFEPTFHPARLKAPFNTSIPSHSSDLRTKNVFTCSMADLFGKWVPDDWIMRVFEVVIAAPQWNFLFLTKFPQRLQEISDKLDGFPDNAWVGTTVDTQARVKVAEKAFQNIDANVKWLSCEPLLERLTFGSLEMFDWVVIGGQSASYFNGTPEFQPEWEWVEHLWTQARDAGCKVYWKENLTVRPKECPW